MNARGRYAMRSCPPPGKGPRNVSLIERSCCTHPNQGLLGTRKEVDISPDNPKR